jgi:hypothetical protein
MTAPTLGPAYCLPVTLTLAWLRTECGNPEIVIASDSRLRPFAWDAAPKIFPLPRGDAVLAFAGGAFYAYPMILQIIKATTSWNPALNRQQDLNKYKGHLLRLLNGMLDEISEPLSDPSGEVPDALFILAGYSWSEARFKIWTLHYDVAISRFTFKPARPWRGRGHNKLIAVVGDETDTASNLIVEMLRSHARLDRGGFDMEPLSALISMMKNPRFETIGGNPQIVKLHRSLNSTEFVVIESGNRSLGGRRLLSYEIPDRSPTFTLDDHPQRGEAGPSLATYDEYFTEDD